MSLAWTTVAFLVLLLPGFLAISAFYIHIPREAGLRNPLSQITATVVISLFIHGAYLLFIDGLLCKRNILPCMNFEYIFSLLNVMEDKSVSLAKLSQNFSDFRWNIILYIFLTGALGTLLGHMIARGVINKKLNFKKLIQHGWVYDLIVMPEGKETVKFAYVLTRIQNNQNVMMYKGSVKDFFASADGELKYLVLSEATRYYMKLNGNNPHTTDHVNIGESSRQVIKDAGTSVDGNSTINNLVIEGEDISNVYFEIIKQPDKDQEIEEIVRKREEKKKMELESTNSDLS